MKVLITGINSLLGLGLLKTLPQGFKIIGLWHNYEPQFSPGPAVTFKQLDICDKKIISACFSLFKPDVIIHTAALSDVDYCEHHPERTNRINVEGTQTVVDASRNLGLRQCIFLSTTAVFDGTRAPYSESAKPHPLSVYGISKLLGEKIIKTSGHPFTIVRCVTMYGWNPPGGRDNPVTWEIKQLRRKRKLKVVSDRMTNPLYNIAAAKAIWSIIHRRALGIIHVAGKTRVSRYEWALDTAYVFGFSKKQIFPVTSQFFEYLTPRPVDTSFQTAKMEKVLDCNPLPLITGLTLMRDEKR